MWWPLKLPWGTNPGSPPMNGIWAEACDVENAMALETSATDAADPNKTLENLGIVISLRSPTGPRVLP